MISPFFEIPENPTPERARADFIQTRDGRRLRYALFGAVTQPHKGTVILLQGRNECVEKYFETIRDLQQRGLAVATYDMRGQGASDRMLSDPQKGYVDSFADHVSDLEQLFREVFLPDCRGPFFILGHSTGSLVALMAAPWMINRVQRMVLSAPLIEMKGMYGFSMPTVRRISTVLYSVGLGTMYLGSGPRRSATPFATNVLTTDHNRYRRNVALYDAYPQLALGGPTVAWIRAACLAVELVMDEDFIARIQLPTLFIAAGSDDVVSTPAIEVYAHNLRSTSMLTIDGARHELMQEADRYREQFLAAFDAFVPGASG